MNIKKNRPEPAVPSAVLESDLRRRSETKVLGKSGHVPDAPEDLSPEDMRRMLHELQVHQRELLMQNEELRRTQAALEAANDRYLSFYDLAPVGLCSLNEKGLIFAANLTFAAWIGVAHGELVNQPLTQFILPEDQNIYYRHREQLFETGEPQACELRLLRRDKMILWVNIEATAAKDSDGAPVCRIVLSDITGRKQTEHALRESKRNLASMFDAITESVFLLDSQGVLLSLNQTTAQRLGSTPQALKGKVAYDFLPEETAISRKAKIEEVFRTGREARFEDSRGGVYFKHALYPVFDDDGKVSRLVVFSHDITCQKRTEDALKASHEQLRELSKHLETAREQERISIAREIHDELGQVLTAIRLETSWLAKKLPKDQKALKSRAEASAELAAGAIQSVKKIIAELRPALLSDLGLAEAIKWQAGEYQKRTGIHCSLRIDLNDMDLNDEISTAVFRIFQESFTNVIRHAKATEMRVSLKELDGEIELIVEDNGVGIAGDSSPGKEDFGIIGMKERAWGLGGKLEISGIPGKGSMVVARIPIHGNAPA